MPGRDAFDELERENPRHRPTFDAAVAGATSHAKQVLAAAAAGVPATVAASAAASPPWGWATTTPARRRRIVGLVLGMGALVIMLLLLATGTISTSPSHRSTTASPGRNDPGVTTGPVGSAPGGLGGGGGTTTTTTTQAPPATSTTGPTTTTSSAVPAGVTTIGTTRVRPTPTTTRPTTPTTPTTVVSGAWPTCVVAAVLPPAFQSVQVQDTGSGLASITNVVITNGTVRIPGFSAGTNAAVLVVATKSDPAQPTRWSFDATDKAGHTTHCV